MAKNLRRIAEEYNECFEKMVKARKALIDMEEVIKEAMTESAET